MLDDQLGLSLLALFRHAGRGRSDIYGGASIGLATLRRDGFASMDGPGELTTRPVKYKGKHLFVNVNGDVYVEMLDEAGKVIATSQVVSGDHTKVKIDFGGAGLRTWRARM